MLESEQLNTTTVELTEEQVEQVSGGKALNIFVGGPQDLKFTGFESLFNGNDTLNIHVHIHK